MELKKISRSKSFEMVNGYGLKLWDKLGIEGDLSENENPLEAYKELGKIIDETFKESYPNAVPQALSEPPDKQVDKPTAKDNMITAITTCTEVATLETFRKLAASKPEFQTAFDNRLKELQP